MSVHPTAASFTWEFSGWNEHIYVLLPAAAYAGNRFRALPLPYSPRLPAEECGRAPPTIITAVPRLSSEPGTPSALHLLSADLAFPLVAWFDPTDGRSWAVFLPRGAERGDVLFSLEETPAWDRATLRITRAGCRPSPVFRFQSFDKPSPDPLPWARADGPFDLVVEEWHAADLPDFLSRVASLRGRCAARETVAPVLPFSAAVELIEEHYHRDFWNEALGLFATTANRNSPYHFQTGWCGGLIATLPLLASELPASRDRARKNLQTFFDHAPTPCGLFLGKCRADGVWEADFAHDTARPHTRDWHLIRRTADALFFGLAQIELLARNESDGSSLEPWRRAMSASAEALASIWEKNGQLGHFVHQHTGEILVGNSASGALAPAALCRAARVLGHPRLVRVAEELGEYLAHAFLDRGFTTGGPGDACQNPDSESAAALVESYAALFDATRDPRWLRRGVAAAHLLATWVMPGDFEFPAGTEFHRLGLRTPGTVFANTQNKHSAPGLCTHSGLGLLRLYRATGDETFIELLTSIARALPQFVSRADRPIFAADGRALPAGWINERVNTSDWDENVGGVFYDACWCEVSLLLTALEIPGVYVRTDLGRAWVADHVEARLEGGALILHNPTAFHAHVRVLAEDATGAGRPLGDLWYLDAPRIALAPGATVTLSLNP